MKDLIDRQFIPPDIKPAPITVGVAGASTR